MAVMAPPRTVGSLAHDHALGARRPRRCRRPCRRRRRSRCRPRRAGDSSRNGVSGSSSRPMRSRTGSLPRARSRAVALGAAAGGRLMAQPVDLGRAAPSIPPGWRAKAGSRGSTALASDRRHSGGPGAAGAAPEAPGRDRRVRRTPGRWPATGVAVGPVATTVGVGRVAALGEDQGQVEGAGPRERPRRRRRGRPTLPRVAVRGGRDDGDGVARVGAARGPRRRRAGPARRCGHVAQPVALAPGRGRGRRRHRCRAPMSPSAGP